MLKVLALGALVICLVALLVWLMQPAELMIGVPVTDGSVSVDVELVAAVHPIPNVA